MTGSSCQAHAAILPILETQAAMPSLLASVPTACAPFTSSVAFSPEVAWPPLLRLRREVGRSSSEGLQGCARVARSPRVVLRSYQCESC